MKYLSKIFLLTLIVFLEIPFLTAGPLKIVKKENSYLLEINDSVIGKDILFGSRVVELSIQKNISAGMTLSNPIVVRFANNGKYLNLEKVITNSVWEEQDHAAPLIAKNNITPVFHVFEIYSRDNTRGITTVDITKYFSEEVNGLSPLPEGIKQGKLETRASGIIDFSNHENRFNIKTKYSYVGGKEPFSVIINYTMLVADNPMKPRYEDERVGFFSSSKTVYNTEKKVYKPKFISKWRVEPKKEDIDKYKAGQLVEPEKPIVFYFDPNTPPLIKKYAILGILDWNQAFENIGFKNTLQVRDYPSSEFNSEDLTINCFRYIPTIEANAAGNIWTDPRSGEIIQGDILWYHNVVKLLQEWRFVQTAATDPDVRGKELNEEILGELIRYAVAHETGHVLGMKHNMRGSYAYPVDSLRSATFTQKYGTTASIMDYARNNYIAQPGDKEKGVKLTPPILGPYDYFAIKWAYTPIFSAQNPEEELPILNELFQEKKYDHMYLYANTSMGPIVPDPSGQSDMLGDDLIKSAKYGISNLKYITENLVEWCFDEGDSYTRMNEMYESVVKQLFKYLNNCASYIGGVYYYPGTVGQYYIHYIPVNKTEQREACFFILEQLKECEDWLSNEKLYGLIGDKSELVMARRISLMESLMSWQIMQRLQSNDYSMQEYFNDFSEGLFSNRKGTLWTNVEKTLQTVYVNCLNRNIEKAGEVKKSYELQAASASQNEIFNIRTILYKKRNDFGHKQLIRNILNLNESCYDYCY